MPRPRLAASLAAAILLAPAAWAQPSASLVLDINTVLDSNSDSFVDKVASADGHTWFFLADRDRHRSLYVADTSSALPRPIHPSAFSAWSTSTPVLSLARADRLFYAIPRDPPNPNLGTPTDLYVADAVTGTHALLFAPVCTGGCNNQIGTIARLDDTRILFTARSGNVWSLYVSDGTPAGTIPIVPSASLDASIVFHPIATGPGVASSRAYFTTSAGPQRRIWTTDGTAAGTVLLWSDNNSNSAIDLRCTIGRTLVFTSDSQYLGFSDGTPTGTVTPAAGPFQISDLTLAPAGDFAIFVARQVNTFRLWRTDGTAAGTVPLFGPTVDPLEPPGCSIVAPLGSGWLVSSQDGQSSALFVTDGTAAGTHRIPGSEGLTAWYGAAVPIDASRVVFTSVAGVYVTDGTGPGTFQLSTAHPTFFAPAVSSTGYFIFVDPRSGVWRTDGTVAGTILVYSLPSNWYYIDDYDHRTSNSITALPGGRVLVRLKGPQYYGTIVLCTDGTAAGTHALATNAITDQFAAVSGPGAVFMSTDPVHGTELWSTDGTPEHTALAINAAADATLASHPTNFRVAKDRLLFTATSGNNWVYATDNTGAHAVDPLTTDYYKSAVPIADGRLCYAVGQIIGVLDPDAPAHPDPNFPGPPLASFPDSAGLGFASLAPLDDRTLLAGVVPQFSTTPTPSGLYTCDLATGTLTRIWTPAAPLEHSIITLSAARTTGPAGPTIFFTIDASIFSTDGRTVTQRTNLHPDLPVDPTRTESPTDLTLLAGGRLVFADANSRLGALDVAGGAVAMLASANYPGFKVFPLVPDHAVAIDRSPVLSAPVWTTDGTPAGTFLHPAVRLTNSPTGAAFAHVGPNAFYFATPNMYGPPLLVAAPLGGPDAATLWTGSIYNPFPAPPTVLRGRPLTLCPDASGLVLRAFVPPSGASTLLLTLPLVMPGHFQPAADIAGTHQGRAYAVRYATTDQPGSVWSVTGNPDGTRQVATIPIGVQYARSEYAFASGRLYFPASDPVHGDELWSVPIPPPCPADFDGDEVVAVADVFAMINAYFAADPIADVDGNYAVEVDDLFAFLTDWFRGCH